MAQQTVTVEDGRISIPEELRQQLGWQPGDSLQMVVQDNEIVVCKLHLALVQ